MTGEGPLPGATQPIERSCLARLIAFGLSDADIEACFSLQDGEARLLRERYKLNCAPKNKPDVQPWEFAGLALDELSNGVQAAVTYLGSAIKCAKRDGSVTTTTVLLMEKSLAQLRRIGNAYRSLEQEAGVRQIREG